MYFDTEPAEAQLKNKKQSNTRPANAAIQPLFRNNYSVEQ
jgi:hypothetical protein